MSDENNLSQSDPWVEASKYIKNLGSVSATFSSAVRALVGDTQNYTAYSKTPYSALATYEIGRLLNSPTLLSHIYYAALTYKPTELKAALPGKPQKIAMVFQPEELAIILAITYFYRRIQRRIKKDIFAELLSSTQQAVEIAFPLGAAIPTLGPVRAMLVAAHRPIAWGMVAVRHPDKMSRYLNSLKVNKKACDLTREMNDFGTTCSHISSYAYQAFGFGLDFVNGLFKGTTHANVAELSDSERRFKVAQIWLDALAQGDVPHETLGDDYELSDTDMDTLAVKVKQLQSTGSELNWLSKGRSDISKEKTPDLEFDYEKSLKLRKRSKKGGESENQEGDEEDAE